MFLAHASISGYSNYPNANKYMSVFSDNVLKYTGANTSTYLFWAADSGNAPPVILRNNKILGTERRITGRALWQGRILDATTSIALPINADSN
jgi:hypothetical protein